MNDDILSPGRVAVVTGAGMGIGAAAARYFAGRGMKLCLFDRNADALQQVAKELAQAVEVRTVVGDVTSHDDLTRLCDTAYDTFREVALLMNNAGIAAGGGPWGDIHAWRHLFPHAMTALQRPQ
ncbi:SDR family NAD(P)-dependent oxidoreductase [Myxococcus sp. 1LA]